MHDFAVDFEDITCQILCSDIQEFALAWDLVTFEISSSDVVAYIVRPSLDVSGYLGVLVVFSHGQGAL